MLLWLPGTILICALEMVGRHLFLQKRKLARSLFVVVCSWKMPGSRFVVIRGMKQTLEVSYCISMQFYTGIAISSVANDNIHSRAFYSSSALLWINQRHKAHERPPLKPCVTMENFDANLKGIILYASFSDHFLHISHVLYMYMYIPSMVTHGLL